MQQNIQQSVPSCSYTLPRAGLSHTTHGLRTAKTNRRAFGMTTNAYGGSQDEFGDELSAEFATKADPQRFEKIAEHLDLLWKVQQRKRPQPCDGCRGSGLLECTWCHGTGALTVGDTLYCSNEGCKTCPVCKGTGDCTCERCRGTGKVASWLQQPSAPLS